MGFFDKSIAASLTETHIALITLQQSEYRNFLLFQLSVVANFIPLQVLSLHPSKTSLFLSLLFSNTFLIFLKRLCVGLDNYGIAP